MNVCEYVYVWQFDIAALILNVSNLIFHRWFFFVCGKKCGNLLNPIVKSKIVGNMRYLRILLRQGKGIGIHSFSSNSAANQFSSHKYCVDLVRWVSWVPLLLNNSLKSTRNSHYSLSVISITPPSRSNDHENFLATLLFNGESQKKAAIVLRAFNVEVAKAAGSVKTQKTL